MPLSILSQLNIRSPHKLNCLSRRCRKASHLPDRSTLSISVAEIIPKWYYYGSTIRDRNWKDTSLVGVFQTSPGAWSESSWPCCFNWCYSTGIQVFCFVQKSFNCLGNSGLEQGEYRNTVIHAIHNLCCLTIKASFKQVGQTCPHQSQKVKFGNTNVSGIAMCQKQVLCYFGRFVFIQL